MHHDTTRHRMQLAAFCCALVAVPFLSVRFPPITDLPQNVAQIRLLLEALADPAGPYRIQWLTPYSLVYALLGGCWALVGPAAAGRVCMLVLAVLWIAAVHLLAARRGRPADAAVVASTLVFSVSLYWGFYSFLVGWPVFVLWLLLTASDDGVPRKYGPLLLAGAVLLYVSHALWLAAGLGWLGLSVVIFGPRKVLVRLAWVAPVVVVAALWFQELNASSFATATVWGAMPWQRLAPSWLVYATFGGLRGPVEYVAVGVLVVWLAMGLVQQRARLREAVDPPLLVCGLMLLATALLAPYKYHTTILFAERWMAPAMALLLLALPAPELPRPALRRMLAVTFAAVFSAATALAWYTFDRTDLSGLSESLDALPAAPRVIGLDFLKESPVIAGRPFVQLAAYAQVLKGGSTNFSFAEYAPELVVYKERPRNPWNPYIWWQAERVTPQDLLYFDYALIGGDANVHAQFATWPLLTPVTTAGRWRLYRVVIR